MFIWSSIAHLIALTSPGPDTAVTIRQVSLYGRNAGIYTALGIGVGIYIHCFLAINGISLFILKNELYKFSISIIGSSYIFYLGISMLKTDSVFKYDRNNFQNSSSIYGSFFSGLIRFELVLDLLFLIMFYIYNHIFQYGSLHHCLVL